MAGSRARLAKQMWSLVRPSRVVFRRFSSNAAAMEMKVKTNEKVLYRLNDALELCQTKSPKRRFDEVSERPVDIYSIPNCYSVRRSI